MAGGIYEGLQLRALRFSVFGATQKQPDLSPHRSLGYRVGRLMSFDVIHSLCLPSQETSCPRLEAVGAQRRNILLIWINIDPVLHIAQSLLFTDCRPQSRH